MSDPQDILIGPWRVQGGKPRVLHVGEVVQAKHLGYRVTVTQPRNLKTKKKEIQIAVLRCTCKDINLKENKL